MTRVFKLRYNGTRYEVVAETVEEARQKILARNPMVAVRITVFDHGQPRTVRLMAPTKTELLEKIRQALGN